MGLDLLVAADIILTVALEPSFESLGMLGLLVLIRTFLHFILELELTGRWPWQSSQEQGMLSEPYCTAAGSGRLEKDVATILKEPLGRWSIGLSHFGPRGLRFLSTDILLSKTVRASGATAAQPRSGR